MIAQPEVLKAPVSLTPEKMKILLLENIHPVAVELLKGNDFDIETYSGALSEDELYEKIQNVSVLGIRSRTQVSARVLQNADSLLAIGAFCIGTNQIDLNAATRRGVAVFNAPYSNTRSVVELAISEMILLIRNIVDKSTKMHQGIWHKSATGSFEIRGKTLGLIGYGSIGAQFSVLAESLGMNVLYYDVEERLSLGTAIQCKTMEEVLRKADVVSVHVDGRRSNTKLISRTEFHMMKKGVIFLNLSRGHVVDVCALRESVMNGKVAGCAIDVFPHEPDNNQEEFKSVLRGLPNTILSPHIGGSTMEAQIDIGNFVPAKIIDYINAGSTSTSINFPNLTLPRLSDSHRMIHVHKNISGILARINQVFCDYGINITGQYLRTNDAIGYVITDINKDYDKAAITKIRCIEDTIKLRMLY